MTVGVSAADERRTEVPAQDLPCFGGAQLATDITEVRAVKLWEISPQCG